jgi:hypothetical protein
MAQTKVQKNSPRFVSGQQLGRDLAGLLLVSPFPESDKAAWAELLTKMDSHQLKDFYQLLLAAAGAKAAVLLDGERLTIQAAQHKRDLSLLAISESAHALLDDVRQGL